MGKFNEGKIRSRKYRNRRIGEFFQEIELSEKKSTGITKILNALEYNGSPPPEFETDPGRHYMITTIRMREGFEAVNEVINEAIREAINEAIREVTDRQVQIMNIMKEVPSITKPQLSERISLSKSTIDREIKKLIESGLIIRSGSNKTGFWEVLK